MRLSLTVRSNTGLPPVEVAVHIDPDAQVSELHRALLANVPGAEAAGDLWAHDTLLRPDDPLGRCGLHDGDEVGLGRPAGPRGYPRGPVLRVTGGPDAGIVLALQTGPLGRADGLTDPDVSRQHVLLTTDTNGQLLVADAGSTNGTLLDGVPVTGPVEWTPEAVLRIGDTRAEFGGVEVASGVRPDGACGLERNRPPRLLPAPSAVRVTLPTAPPEERARALPVVALLAPLVMGVVLALVLGPRFLIFALLGPVMLGATWLSDRRQGRVSRERARLQHAVALAAAYAELQRARAAEGRLRRQAHPDPGIIALTASGPGSRLWERRPTDPDHLDLRVGTATLPSRVELVGGPPAEVSDVPVVLPLAEVGVLGLAGARARTRAVARALLAQLAVLHRPQDLHVVVLTDRTAEHEWGWLALLPHARAGEVVLIGNDSKTVATRLAELAALLHARVRGPDAAGRTIVVFLDGACALRRLPGAAALLREGPAVGIHLVCLDDEAGLLPEECAATLTCTGSFGHLQRSLHEDICPLLLEPVTVGCAERVARALLPLRDRDDHSETGLPETARLLDLLNLDSAHGLDPAHLAARWGRKTAAVLGAGSDGPFHVDLVRDGPHALVAGTTGSGKSELLQSLVISLAVANSPEAMSFVLVDYKGGSAFRDCARLPHTAGMVTDLDTHLVGRALASLRAELTRREHLLAEAGASDLESLERAGAHLERLVIVIDEFAALARELPEFVTGLVGVAQRGRSLGVHLVLATQRPSGVISPEIRANTDLRIALRVTDAAESTDVVDVADAAALPREFPGRGIVRLGQGVLAAFQGGRVNGRPSFATGPVLTCVTRRSWSALGRVPVKPALGEPEGPTDLSLIVDALIVAGRDRPRVRRPWLPALPAHLPLKDLTDRSDRAAAAGAVFGLLDVPDQQAQPVASWDPSTAGHLLIVGAPRSGRTQLLLTLAGALAARYRTRDVHLYTLDCGGGGLRPLGQLPHCGVAVTREQPERAARLLTRLVEQVTRRQALLAAGHLPGPHTVLLLDRWEGFTAGLGELDSGALHEQVLMLLREGAGVKVHVVATGDRSLLLGRVASTTPDRIVLRLADRGDYAVVGLDPRQVPDNLPPGRGVLLPAGHELQVALGPPIEDLAADCRARKADLISCEVGDEAPMRIQPLPEQVPLGQVRSGGLPLFAVLGVGGDDLDVVGIDLARGTPALLVCGPPRSGRSTALVALARCFVAQGAAVVLISPRPSPVRALAGEPGVRAVLTDVDADTLLAALAGERPVAVLLDDAELLRDCPAASLLTQLAGGALPGRALVAAGSTEGLGAGFTGWHVQVRQARQGLLLSPRSAADGDLLGCRLPRSALAGPVIPGRGLAHLGDGQLIGVQVPA